MFIVYSVFDRQLVLVTVVQNLPRLDILVFVIVVVGYGLITKTPDIVHSPQSLFIIEVLEL
jgi:hypothetical protein